MVHFLLGGSPTFDGTRIFCGSPQLSGTPDFGWLARRLTLPAWYSPNILVHSPPMVLRKLGGSPEGSPIDHGTLPLDGCPRLMALFFRHGSHALVGTPTHFGSLHRCGTLHENWLARRIWYSLGFWLAPHAWYTTLAWLAPIIWYPLSPLARPPSMVHLRKVAIRRLPSLGGTAPNWEGGRHGHGPCGLPGRGAVAPGRGGRSASTSPSSLTGRSSLLRGEP